MADFNEIFDKVVEIGKTAVDTTVDFATTAFEKGKQKVDVALKNNELKDAYCELGKFCYATEKGEEIDLGKKAQLMTRIEEILREIQA